MTRRLEYRERGSGEPVVFVHGSASDSRTWHLQLDEFAKHFRAITYSRRYHWPHQPIDPGQDYAMDDHVSDLKALLHSLDTAPAHIVGHSYGALVALLLAIQAPHLVRTLVLAEPPAITLFVSNSPKPFEILKLLVTRPRTAIEIIRFGATAAGPAKAAARRGHIDEAIRVFAAATLGPGAFERLSDARLEQARANFSAEELLGSGFPPLEPASIRRVSAPTLLLTAQNSSPLFRPLIQRLEELLPVADRAEIPAAAHIMHEDNAPAFNAAVLSFLARRSSPDETIIGA
ncbi:MAG: alpha/beta hydrolase [Bryobacteraceae bacterium]